MGTDSNTNENSIHATPSEEAKRLAHERAQETDLREHFTRGGQIGVFVETPDEKNGVKKP